MSYEAWTWIAVGVVLVAELISGRHKRVHRLQDVLLVATVFATGALIFPYVAMGTAALVKFLMPTWSGAFSAVPFWPAFIVILLVSELALYGLHRIAHDPTRHYVLWGMHRTHHTAPYVNVTLMYRANIAWGIIHPYGLVAAAAIYLGQGPAAGAVLLTARIWNVLTHSDWRWDDAIAKMPGGARIVNLIELVFITPRIHHAHHGFGADGKQYRNFCTVLSLYDRVFSTLYVPQARPQHYGVPGGEHHWLRQVLFPLLPLGKAVKRDRLNRPIEAPAS